jgi:hypothetical protein
MDNIPKELENTYFSYAKLFEMHVIPLLTREIIIKEEDDRRLLTIFIKHFKEHPENLPHYIIFLIKSLKASFHPKVLDIYPHKTSTEIEAFFRNPFVYASDYFFCFIHKGHDDAKILNKHVLILQTFGALVRVQEAFYGKLEKEIYGKKIFDFYINSNEEALSELKSMALSSKKNVGAKKNLDKQFSSLKYKPPRQFESQNQVSESESVAFEAILRFLNKQKKKSKLLGDYLPEEVPENIREVLSSDKKNVEMAQICSDAVNGTFRILNQKVHNLLVDAFKPFMAQKRDSGGKLEPLTENFTLPLSVQEDGSENESLGLAPDALKDGTVYFGKLFLSEEEERVLNIIQDEPELKQKEKAKRLSIDPKTYRKRKKILKDKFRSSMLLDTDSRPYQKKPQKSKEPSSQSTTFEFYCQSCQKYFNSNSYKTIICPHCFKEIVNPAKSRIFARSPLLQKRVSNNRK